MVLPNHYKNKLMYMYATHQYIIYAMSIWMFVNFQIIDFDDFFIIIFTTNFSTIDKMKD